jgi:hypothetical protein
MEGVWNSLAAWRLRPWRPDFTAEEERARAAAGALVAGQRRGELGERVISVSLPIQRVEAVIGILTVEAGDVDEIIRRERRAMLPFFVGAWAVTALASFLLALTIAIPVRQRAETIRYQEYEEEDEPEADNWGEVEREPVPLYEDPRSERDYAYDNVDEDIWEAEPEPYNPPKINIPEKKKAPEYYEEEAN